MFFLTATCHPVHLHTWTIEASADPGMGEHQQSQRLFHGCIILIFILVLSNISTIVKYKQSNQRNRRDVTERSEERQRNFILEMLNQTTKKPMSNTLKKKLFQEKYERPHKKLVKSFPKHPNAVISKILNEIREEEVKLNNTKEEIGLLKGILGLSVDGLPEQKKRKKRSSNVDYIEYCPERSPHLLGPLRVDESVKTMKEAESRVTKILPGGKYSSLECQPQQKVAFIIPFRYYLAVVWLSGF